MPRIGKAMIDGLEQRPVARAFARIVSRRFFAGVEAGSAVTHAGSA